VSGLLISGKTRIGKSSTSYSWLHRRYISDENREKVSLKRALIRDTRKEERLKEALE